jgi:8-oxo-dGTP pyrophosphatase MutT (NUDIX family)
VGCLIVRTMDSQSARFKERIRGILASRVRRRLDDRSLTCAAVLVPLLFKNGEWYALVTQRTQHVEHHKGQISFPGGACDPDDADLQATALRETCEEVGIPREAVEILGALDDLRTITDFAVTPIVGVIPHPFDYRLNGDEVEAIIEVPLTFLLDPSHRRVEQREYKGRIYDVQFWDYGTHTIWGATASILKSFLDLL